MTFIRVGLISVEFDSFLLGWEGFGRNQISASERRLRLSVFKALSRRRPIRPHGLPGAFIGVAAAFGSKSPASTMTSFFGCKCVRNAAFTCSTVNSPIFFDRSA